MLHDGKNYIIRSDLLAANGYTQRNVLLNQQKFGWSNKIFRLNMGHENLVWINLKDIVDCFCNSNKKFCMGSKKYGIAN